MKRIGRYEILEEVARGGMGVVYRARDSRSGRTVALKLMLSLSNPTSSKRFKREAEALAKVSHANVVRLLDYGQAPSGEPFMVMELVEGESLQDRLVRGGPLDPHEAVEVAAALCGAVGACHAVYVLHRDLKPDNVLVARDGTLKLTDFGLARDADPSLSRTRLSVTGRFMGSPGFWAPEQAAGDLGTIGERTDVYGLGATLFALLTGRPPHSGQGLVAIMKAVLEEKPAPSSLNPAVPTWLDRVVRRSLATDPADRFARVEELAAALRGGAVVAPGLRGSAARVAARVAAVGVVAAGLLAAVLVVGAEKPAERAQVPAQVSPTAEAVPVESLDSDAEAQAALERGNALVAAGRPAESLGHYTEAIKLQPGFAAAYAIRGVARGKLGDLQGWVEDCTEAIKLQPGFAEAYTNRGIARGRLGDRQGQLGDCTEAIRLQPDHAPSYYNRGVARANQRDWQGAARDYTDAIRLRPSYASAHYNRGVARGRLGDWQGAAEDYTQAIRLQPDDAQALSGRGFAREKLGDWQGAAEDYTQLIRLQPDGVGAYANRGEARLELGDHEGAIEDWERALELEPDGSWALWVGEQLQLARQQLAER